jgi:hypothetical protein
MYVFRGVRLSKIYGIVIQDVQEPKRLAPPLPLPPYRLNEWADLARNLADNC